MSGPFSRRALASVLLAIAWGCQPSGGPGVVGTDPPTAEAPAYAEVARAYNARVEPLAELWSACVVRVWYTNEKGEESSDQVDAHLQVRRPDRCALTFEKVGETYLVLGCDPARYWWFDLTEEPTSLVGSHAKVTPERLADFGLPIHPLDLIDVLGVVPLADDDVRASVASTADGTVLTLPGRWGSRRLTLDARAHEPSVIELLDDAGVVQLRAELSKYEPVEVRGPGATRFPSEVLVTIASAQAKARIRLYDTRNHGTRDPAFDLDRLQNAYRIARTIDLDEP